MRLLTDSNLFIAAAAALLTLATDRLLGAPLHFDPLIAAMFFGTLVVYNLDRLAEPAAAESDGGTTAGRDRWIACHRRPLWALVIVSIVALAIILPLLPWRTLALIAMLGGVGFAYSFPLLGRVPRSGDRLRDFAGAKAFLVAAVWSLTTVILPALETPQLSLRGGDVALLLIERFLFVAAITLPFDLRDRERDAAVGLHTISARLGVVGTRRLCLALIVLSTVLSAIHWAPRPQEAAALAICGGVTMALLAGLRDGLSEWYYSVALDGTLILQALLILTAT